MVVNRIDRNYYFFRWLIGFGDILDGAIIVLSLGFLYPSFSHQIRRLYVKRVPAIATKYRPANGAEGDFFMEQFCNRCIHDDPDNLKLCSIIAASMSFDVEEEGYPDDWRCGENGPICTKFKESP